MSDDDDPGYDEEAYALYLRQQVRPSAEEIAGVADQLWADPLLGPVFRRVGIDGDLTESEDQATRRFISNRQVGALGDRRFMDLWLATGLVRRRAAGLFDDFRSEAAQLFIADRILNASNGSPGHVGVDTTVHEVYDLARAMLSNSEMVALFRRRPSNQETSDEDLASIIEFQTAYQWKYCLGNRSSLVMATRIASKLARGEVSSMGDPEILDWLRSDRRVVGLPEVE